MLLSSNILCICGCQTLTEVQGCSDETFIVFIKKTILNFFGQLLEKMKEIVSVAIRKTQLFAARSQELVLCEGYWSSLQL